LGGGAHLLRAWRASSAGRIEKSGVIASGGERVTANSFGALRCRSRSPWSRRSRLARKSAPSVGNEPDHLTIHILRRGFSRLAQNSARNTSSSTPIVIAASATLNNQERMQIAKMQIRENRNESRARTRSVMFPAAPPNTSPSAAASSRSPRATARKHRDCDPCGQRYQQPTLGHASGVRKPIGNAMILYPYESEDRQDIDSPRHNRSGSATAWMITAFTN